MNRPRGFSLFEFAVVVSLIGILGAILLDRLHYYQAAAEKVNMEVTARAMQTAVRLEMANDLMAGRRVDYPRLLRHNPVDWLEKKPANYLGEYDHPDPARLAPGNWYFDRGQRELVYLVGLGGLFRPDSAGLKRVRYRVGLIRNGGGIATVRLEPVEPYLWAIP